MNAQSEQQDSSLDPLKWVLVGALIVVGVIGNRYFSDVSVLLRVVVLLGLAIAAGFIALQTSKGRRGWAFALQARTEMRKVVWPARPEVLQTTLMVVVMVVVMALILWGLDALFFRLIAWLTGQGG